jgi:hypothetical protein
MPYAPTENGSNRNTIECKREETQKGAESYMINRFNIISVIKSLRTIWSGRVAHVEEMTNAYTILVQDL